MTDLSFAFQKPFPQQIAAFRIRLQELKATTDWTDVWQEANDKAFMVAGAQKLELLADFAAAIDKAVTKGTTFDEFKRDFRKAVADNDWKGWTGERTEKGQAWRARVIYKTNLSTSYAAGRLAQLRKSNFKFWVYRHGASREPRRQHLAWDGLILPSDHPFWETHYPPNGWGCSCYVVGSHTFKGATRMGGNPTLQLPEDWQKTNPSTLAPQGIDKGWAYAPGSSVTDTINSLTERAVNWEYSLATAYMRSLPDQTRDAFSTAFRRSNALQTDLEDFAAKAVAAVSDEERTRTMGLVTRELATRIEDQGGAFRQDSLYDVTIAESAVRHIIDRHSNAVIELTRAQHPLSTFDFGLLGRLINAPDEVVAADPVPRRQFMVRMSKRFGDRVLVAIFEIQSGRRRLSLVTMWMEKVGASSAITP